MNLAHKPVIFRHLDIMIYCEFPTLLPAPKNKLMTFVVDALLIISKSANKSTRSIGQIFVSLAGVNID